MNISSWAVDLPAAGLSELLGRSAPLEVPPAVLALVLAIAAVLAVPRASWRWFGIFTTLVHELGHAVAALLTGRLVTGIHLRSDHSGSAVSRGRGGFGPVFSGFFGYPAPALVGSVLVWAVFEGWTNAALAAGAAAIAVTLLFVRNLFGVFVVLASSGVSVALWVWATPPVQSIGLLALGIALLVGSVRGLATVVGVHVSHRQRLATSDAYLLARRTGVPSPVWLLGFAAVIAACWWWAWSVYQASL